MSRTSSKRKTNDPMGNKVLRTLGLDSTQAHDARPCWSAINGPVHGKINPTQYRNRECYCGSGLKFKHCCLNKKETVDAVQGGGQEGDVKEGRNVAREADVQERGERQEGNATPALEDGGVK